MRSQIETPRDARTVAAVGGVVYAIVVLWWLFSAGLSVSSRGTTAVVVAMGYAWIGMFLTAAVPLYLFCRLSLVSPPLATLWILGTTVHQWLYGTHLHPLSSYVNIWPVLLGVTVAITLGETLLRIALDRTVGRFGLHSVL